MADETEVEADDIIGVADVPTNWEFTTAPTMETVTKLLETLSEVWGVKMVDFIDYVQPLSQSKNFKQGKNEADDYRTVWHLYVSVAGRMAMLNQAQMKNGWRVDFEPEPETPTGIPGYLAHGDRIVVREYITIRRNAGEGDEFRESQMLGRRSGTAWVPGTGGSGAVSTNRYEKVETSARGRALAAWGFGVLPGSGVASLEEMQAAKEYRGVEEPTQRGGQQRQGGRVQTTRPELIEQANVAIEEFAQISGLSPVAIDDKVKNFVQRTFAKELVHAIDDPWDFSLLKDGEITLMTRRISGETAKLKNEAVEL